MDVGVECWRRRLVLGTLPSERGLVGGAVARKTIGLMGRYAPKNFVPDLHIIISAARFP